jgi:phosphonate transport system permease protein
VPVSAVPVSAVPGPARDPALAARAGLTLAVLLALWPAAQLAEFRPAALADPKNLDTMAKFLSTFFPLVLTPDFLALVAKATLDTLALATAGTALAMLAGLPLAMAVAASLSVSRVGPARDAWRGTALRAPVRWLLVFMRSIPEIVWALLFVRAIGLGPAAGVLAIAISYAGMLGKVYFEIFESGDTRAARAILEAGGGRTSAFLYGILPATLHELVSYSVYRWECAVRASVVMGFVGAGGLGQQMELSMRMLAGGEVATMLAAFLLLVLLADAVSALLRRTLV